MVNLIPVDFCLDICFKIGLMGSKFHGPPYSMEEYNGYTSFDDDCPDIFLNLFFYFLPVAVLCDDRSLVDSVETYRVIIRSCKIVDPSESH